MIEKDGPDKKREKGKNGYRFSFVNDSQILPLRLTGNNAINFQLCSVNPLLGRRRLGFDIESLRLF